ncbi:MAG TPA: hypothetical protein VGB10_03200 [Bacteroidota bacterium]
MKQFLLFLILMMSATPELSAQFRQRVSLSFGGGVAFPTDPADFSDNWKTGYGITGELEVPIFQGDIALVGAYRYNFFSFDETEFRDTFLSSGQQPQTITRINAPDAIFRAATIGGKYFAFRGALYTRLDVGYFTLARGIVSVVGPDTTTTINFISKNGTLINLGAGISIPLSTIFDGIVEASYYWAKSDQDERTGSTIFSGLGSREAERKNTFILNMRAVVRVKL